MIEIPKNSFKFVIVKDEYGFKIRCHYLRKKYFFFGNAIEKQTDIVYRDCEMIKCTFYGESIEECENTLRKYFRKKNEKIIREISLEEIYENCEV